MTAEQFDPFLQPIAGNCDWLAWSLVDCEPPADDVQRVRWQHGGNNYVAERAAGTAVWLHRWLAFNADTADKVATILMQPKSRLFRADAGLLEVANEWLYHGIGWEGIAAAMRHQFGGKRIAVSRWDYAYDFTPSPEQAATIRALAQEQMYVQGKRSGVTWWQNLGQAAPAVWQGRCPHCLSWGHKTTAVRWKLYYKSLELAVPAMRELPDGSKVPAWVAWDKPYIVDKWRAAGLDVRNVWRVEVSVKHGKSLQADGNAVPCVMDWVTMNRIAGSLYRERFIVRRNQHHADRSNDERVPFIMVGRTMDVRATRYEDGEPRNARITLLRQLIKALETPEVYLSDNSREWVIAHVLAMVEADHLGEYCRRMLGADVYSFVEAIRCKSAI